MSPESLDEVAGYCYLVRYNGREYALKWYFISRIKNPEAFRNNLRKNIEDGAPEGGKQFIWPLFLTETRKMVHLVI